MEDRITAPEGVRLLYHERQREALCGVHTLNTLLQGPYFSEVDLAQIAQELDALEQQFMAESGVDSEDYLRFMAEESGNVAANGMFSIQVLSKALEVWGLRAVPLDSPKCAALALEPHRQNAFICNLQEHWFTILRLDGDWWNFNSLFSAPQELSHFYLSAFLDTLRSQGYTIFVVQGPLPSGQHPDAGSRDTPGSWFTAEQARAMTEESKSAKQAGYLKAALTGALSKASEAGLLVTLRPAGRGRGNAHDDDDVSQAIAASLADTDGPSSSASANGASRRAPASMEDDEDADLAAAIAASLAAPPSVSAPPTSSGAPASTSPIALQPPLDLLSPAMPAAAAGAPAPAAAALNGAPTAQCSRVPGQHGVSSGAENGAAEQQVGAAEAEEVEAGPGTIEIALRLPDGERALKRFRAADPVKVVTDFLSSRGIDMQTHVVTKQWPRQALADETLSLQAVGVGDKEMLNVEKRR